jgi:leucyl aminopeptidase (aminopeptidase T)
MEKALEAHCIAMADAWGEREVRKLTGEEGQSPYNRILDAARGDNFTWLYRYGMPVTREESELAGCFFSLSPQELYRMAMRIVDAFLHGFISQSRTRRGRRCVRVYYQIGLEALVKQILRALEDRGLLGIVQKPEALLSRASWQNNYFCIAPGYSSALGDALIDAYTRACAAQAVALKNCCGMIFLGHFGEARGNSRDPFFSLKAEEQVRFRKFTESLRSIDRIYLPPDDLSFCKVIFPNPWVGKDFKSIFDAFWQLYMEKSDPYELQQQVLIDALDTCEQVRIRGVRGNETDLTIHLFPLPKPQIQTKFLNCGGDLNIPYGEAFTTPRLQGTFGKLHIPRVYLNGTAFKDLYLVFAEGRVTDYGCGNFSGEKRNRHLVWERLLDNRDSLPIGEFAIGTNTAAYTLINRYDLRDRVPILLAEKTGPHIALGDPCFARGEASPVYNLFDHKEMIARWNEATAPGPDGLSGGTYTNQHTDITIPFDEIGLLEGIRASGDSLPIIEKGRFVLPGTEGLNRGFEKRAEE